MPKKPLSKFWEVYKPNWSVSPDHINDRLSVSQHPERLTPKDHNEPKPEGYMRLVTDLINSTLSKDCVQFTILYSD